MGRGKDKDGGASHSQALAVAPTDKVVVEEPGCRPHPAAWRVGEAEATFWPE